MPKKVKGIVRSVLFLGMLISMLSAVNQILVPKYIYANSTWPTTSSYQQFYEMRENSIDVLFLGSSVCVNAFSPQEIYNLYGIRSYNLGSEQQSIFLSYYWLKEALRFQNPQAVVLDTRFLMTIHPESKINTTEGLTRKCLDPMKWSRVKAEAVKDLCTIDEAQSELSYYLTNIRFHSRWNSLTEYDIDLSRIRHAELKGYSAIADYNEYPYEPFELKEPDSYKDFDASVNTLMMEYLNRTVELCKENQIRLILVSLPGNKMNDGIHNGLTRYAEEHELDYYNLCEKQHYENIGAVLPRENVIGHENLWGSIKMSQYIGKILSETYGVAAVGDEQWENTEDYYTQIIKNCELTHISDFAEYLKAVDDSCYSVFISVQEDAGGKFSDEVKQALKELGLKIDVSERPGYSYYAVLNPGEPVIEQISKEGLTRTGSFRNGRSVYSITSQGAEAGKKAQIEIDGVEYTVNKRGFNIVVYDHMTMRVIDRVRFDTKGDNKNAVR